MALLGSFMTLSFQRWGLGAKLSFLTGVAVAALFLLFTFALSHKASEQLEALALEDLHNQTTSVVDMAQMFDLAVSVKKWQALPNSSTALFRNPSAVMKAKCKASMASACQC
ncbi:Methyl-accepting chemotaxis protein [Cronobacter sakazakii 680]|nr:Methyl-accepting chemotaxis protein [Cronobacter sakazakii 680]